jgi:hypothetical protein
MKLVFAIACAINVFVYASAACDNMNTGIVIIQIITGPADLVTALLTPENKRTEYQLNLIAEEENELMKQVI